MNLKTLLTVYPQYLLPHHLLSNAMANITHCKNRLLKNAFIRLIIRLYGVDMNEAKINDLDQFQSFNHFFTRELRDGARQFPSETNTIACPADGAISQIGLIERDQIFQAKGHSYSLLDLLGGNSEHAKAFENGAFVTIYLSPKDYHRLHMPMAGHLREMIHIPGRLFSVNNATVSTVPKLFARNERVVCLFNSDAGPMALILVGAIFVSSIETVWHGVVTPPTINEPRHWHYEDNAPTLEKGAEMGRFNMGSTIIVLFGEQHTTWLETLQAGDKVNLGQSLGKLAH